MSWMTGLGWKDGLTGIQIQKVEELEKNLTKATNNVNQKQMLIDGMNQSLDKLKRKNEEDQKESGSLQYDLTKVQKTCQELEDKNQALRAELKTKDAKFNTIQDHLEKTSKQLENASNTVKRLETDREKTVCPPTPGSSSVSQTPRRSSVTPLKRESIRIGTSADIDPMERIAELEKKLSEREQESKDLEVKLFEASFTDTSKAFEEEAPLLGRHKTTSRTLFDEEPLPARKTNMYEDNGFMDGQADNNISTHNIASRHKGSSISFGYNTTPPDQRKMNKISSTSDVFKTPSAKNNDYATKAQHQGQNRKINSRIDQSRNDDFGQKPNNNPKNTGDPSHDDSHIQEYKKQLDAAKHTLSQLESSMKSKENEVSTLRIDLATAQSQLEKLRIDLKKRDTELNKNDSNINKIQIELEKQTNKAADLEAKIAKLQQENKCHIHNAEATKQALELKLKQQEKELKTEASDAQNIVHNLTKEIEETKKQLTQDKNGARQAENTLKAQLEKLEAEKSNLEKTSSISNAKINQLENGINGKEKAYEEATKKLEAITREKNNYASKCEQLESKLSNIEKEVEGHKKSLTAKESLVQSLQEKIESSQKEHDTISKNKKQEKELCEIKVEELKASLEKSEKDLEEYKCSTKEKMDKIQSFEDETQQSRIEVEKINKKMVEMKKEVEIAGEQKLKETQKAEKAVAEKMASELKQWELDDNIITLNNEKVATELEIKNLEKEKSSQTAIQIELRSLIEKHNCTIEQKEKESISLRSEMDLHMSNYVEIKEKNETLEKHLTLIEAHNNEHINALSEKNGIIDQLKAKKDEMMAKLEESITEKQEMIQECKQLEEDISIGRQKVEQVIFLVKEKTDEVEKKAKDIETLEMNLTDMKNLNEQRAIDIDNKVKTLEENANNLKKMTGENKVLSNKIEYIKTKSVQAVDDLKITEKQVGTLERELKDLKSKLSNSNIAVAELQEDSKTNDTLIANYKVETQSKDEELDSIASRLKDKEGENEGLRSQIQVLETDQEKQKCEQEQEEEIKKNKIKEFTTLVSSLQTEVQQKKLAIENLSSFNKIKDKELDELKEKKENLDCVNSEIKMEILSVSTKSREISDKNETCIEEIQHLRMKNNELQEKLQLEMKKSVEIHDQLAQEIEKQETSIKAKKIDLTCAQEKIDELKNILEDKESKITELETISLKNEESHNIHHDEMTFKINEMVKTVEDLNERLTKSQDLCEIREKDIKEIDVLMKTKEADFNQISNRFEDLQIEYEDLQVEKSVLIQNINGLSQNILYLKAEKEEAKDFLEVLQRQNDELICQNEESSTKLRQTEDIVETGKHRILELEKLHSFSRKSLEEKHNRVEELEKEEDRMANCIVELEQKCGVEKSKLKSLTDKMSEYEELIQKLKDAEEMFLKKIDDLDDASSYDKEYIVQLETEICHLKQAKSKIESNKEKIKEKLADTEDKLKKKSTEFQQQSEKIILLQEEAEIIQTNLQQNQDKELIQQLEKVRTKKDEEIGKLNSIIDEMEGIYEDQELKITKSERELSCFTKEKEVLENSLHDLNSCIINLKKDAKIKSQKENVLEAELDVEKEKLTKSLSAFLELKTEFLCLKSYKESIEIEMSKNETILTENSDKFYNMESELELMKIDVQNKEVSIVSLNKKLVEEKETLAEYVSKLNITLNETKKELDSKCTEIQKINEENSKLVSEINVVKRKEITLQQTLSSIQYEMEEKEIKMVTLQTDIYQKETMLSELKIENSSQKIQETINNKESKISNLEIELKNVKIALEKKVNEFKEVEVDLRLQLELISQEKSDIEIVAENKKKEIDNVVTEHEMKIQNYEKEKAVFVERIENLRIETSDMVDTQKSSENYVKQLTIDLDYKLNEKADEIARIQQFHASALCQVQEHLTKTKLDLEKVMDEKIEIENNLYVVKNEKDMIEQEISQLQKNFEKEIDLKGIIDQENFKTKAEYDFYVEECESLKEKLTTVEIDLSKNIEEKETLQTKIVIIQGEISLKEEEFEIRINEKLKPFKSEMSTLHIEINEKENEILALEEKLEVALVKIEKTIYINTELTNSISEKTVQLEEYALIISDQKKAVEEKQELLIILQEKEMNEETFKQEITQMKDILQEQTDTKASLMERLVKFDVEKEKLGDERLIIEKEMSSLQQTLDEEKSQHEILLTKHEIVIEKFEKLKIVEIQIEDLSEENTKLVQINEDMETKVER